MYRYEDEKVRLQLEYDKLLQKYQVQLAAQYTIPLGSFLSILFGFSSLGIKIPNILSDDMMKLLNMTIAVIILIILYLLFSEWLHKTERDMKRIKNRLVKIENLILKGRS